MSAPSTASAALPIPETIPLPLGLPDIQPDSSRRKGKVARLPKPLRDLINHMLDDGFTYSAIIHKLAEQGVSLNHENLSNWREGGYQDALKEQAWRDELHLRYESASDLLADTDSVQLPEVSLQLAVLGLYEKLRSLMQVSADSDPDPDQLVRLSHALARLTRSVLQLQQYRDRQRKAKADEEKRTRIRESQPPIVCLEPPEPETPEEPSNPPAADPQPSTIDPQPSAADLAPEPASLSHRPDEPYHPEMQRTDVCESCGKQVIRNPQPPGQTQFCPRCHEMLPHWRLAADCRNVTSSVAKPATPPTAPQPAAQQPEPVTNPVPASTAPTSSPNLVASPAPAPAPQPSTNASGAQRRPDPSGNSQPSSSTPPVSTNPSPSGNPSPTAPGAQPAGASSQTSAPADALPEGICRNCGHHLILKPDVYHEGRYCPKCYVRYD